MNIFQLLDLTVARNASDLHLSVGFPPIIRVHGELIAVPGEVACTPEEIKSLTDSLLNKDQKEIFEKTLELDCSYEYQNKGRFRVNVYRQKGYIALSIRLIPFYIPSLEEIGLPKNLQKLTEVKQGFVLVTGPTGHGKSTTLASFINKINLTRSEHILTVEDPIEYVYPKGKSLIEQREMYIDTKSWDAALKESLRQDPDVVLVGEMRDIDTMSAAMTIAETGHLVFATLHTNSAAQSIDRIIDVFPEIQQPQIRLQLAATLEAIISQRLIPTIAPGRVLATEIMLATPATRNLIREGKTHLIDNVIETQAELGMRILEVSLAELVKSGKITEDIALRYALRPALLSKLLR